MKLIKRNIEDGIRKRLFTGKAIVIMGARQVGKTTLLKQLFTKEDDVYWMSGDEQDVRDLFENITATRLKAYIGPHQVLIIDEAQRISDVGIKLKLIVDQIPEVQLVATGSSLSVCTDVRLFVPRTTRCPVLLSSASTLLVSST